MAPLVCRYLAQLHLQTKIHDGSIQAEKLVFEAQTLAGRRGLRRLQDCREERFKQLPRSMGVSVGQHGTFWWGLQAKMAEFYLHNRLAFYLEPEVVSSP